MELRPDAELMFWWSPDVLLLVSQVYLPELKLFANYSINRKIIINQNQLSWVMKILFFDPLK